MRAPALTIGGLAAATLALHLRDPHVHGSWGVCPSLAVLGVYCPGCGGLRAVNDLTDLRVGDALSSNVLVTVAIPFVSLLLAVWAVDRWRGVQRDLLPWRVVRRAQYAVLALLVVFTVLRNIPGSWLAP